MELPILLLTSAFFVISSSQFVDPIFQSLIDQIYEKNNQRQNPNVPDANKNECECVPYYQCSNGSIITDGSGLIDIRIDKDGPCGTNYLEMCCKLEEIRDKNPSTFRPPVVKEDFCGKRNPKGVGFRITGGSDEAEYGEFPWMVGILQEKIIPGTNTIVDAYVCGGSLVHPRAVITSAHCVSDKNNKYKIRAGEWDTATEDEIFPFQSRDVLSINIHPDYYRGGLFNDIAFLVLESPIDVIDTIDIVCLPPSNVVVEDARCFVSGWGKNSTQGRYQNILKKLELPLVNRQACQEKLRTTRVGKYFRLHESFICAGGEPGKDACKGDGGSPLVCPIPGKPDKYFQAGIVAWGIDCGSSIPGVYANVAYLRSWIDEQMALNNLRPRYDSY